MFWNDQFQKTRSHTLSEIVHGYAFPFGLRLIFEENIYGIGEIDISENYELGNYKPDRVDASF